MRRSVVFCLFAAGLLLTAACSDSSGPAAPAFTVGGTVHDPAGEPLADVAVLLDLDFVVAAPTAADKPRTSIAFDLPAPARYELRITDVCDDEIFYAVTDSATEPGVSIVWDGRDLEGRDLAEGYFHAHLEVAGYEPVVRDLALARNLGDEPGDFGTVACATVRESWRVAAWTDGDGRFTVARDCWEFGQSTTAYDEQGAPIGELVVAPRVRAWAYAPGAVHGVASAWTAVDAGTGAQIDIEWAPQRRLPRIP